MITAQEYFEKYLAWKHGDSSLRSAKQTYAPYSALELADLQAEAEANSPGAMEELGERYLFGLSELKQDPETAQKLLREAAEAGHPDAKHMLAEIHRTGDAGKVDLDRYFPLLQKAAEGGSWKAMFNLSCAYYKGKAAYEGHGFEVNRLKALEWSTRCGVLTMELLEFYLTHNCSQDFTEYMQGVYALFVQSICVSARQLIRGDGVKKDLQWAKTMLTDAQSFYRHYFEAGCADFDALLQYCQE